VDHVVLRTEIDLLKQEDFLDECGRIKPIVIESECDLVERLQLNEFLYQAQMKRNPIPSLIEKISHLLEMIHVVQVQADGVLKDLRGMNEVLVHIRQKNRVAEEKAQECEAWKLDTLRKIVSNAFAIRPTVQGCSSQEGCALYVDNLEASLAGLRELRRLMESCHRKAEVREIRLRGNQLSDEAVPLLCQLLELCPYLRRLDLRENHFQQTDVAAMRKFVERMQGVTVSASDLGAKIVEARSGNQVRFVIDLEDQEPFPTDNFGAGAWLSEPSVPHSPDLNGVAGRTSPRKGSDADVVSCSTSIADRAEGAGLSHGDVAKRTLHADDDSCGGSVSSQASTRSQLSLLANSSSPWSETPRSPPWCTSPGSAAPSSLVPALGSSSSTMALLLRSPPRGCGGDGASQGTMSDVTPSRSSGLLRFRNPHLPPLSSAYFSS